MPDAELTAIRNEAIACLALFDLRESAVFSPRSSDGNHQFDSAFQIYTAAGSKPNELYIRQVSNNARFTCAPDLKISVVRCL
jgi:hypothetical protein